MLSTGRAGNPQTSGSRRAPILPAVLPDPAVRTVSHAASCPARMASNVTSMQGRLGEIARNTVGTTVARIGGITRHYGHAEGMDRRVRFIARPPVGNWMATGPSGNRQRRPFRDRKLARPNFPRNWGGEEQRGASGASPGGTTEASIAHRRPGAQTCAIVRCNIRQFRLPVWGNPMCIRWL